MLDQQLQTYYQQHHADAVISEIHAISDGWETEVHRFTVITGGQEYQRILRMYPGDDATVKSAHEFEQLQLLHLKQYPVPEVFFLETSPDSLGKPFMIMEFIEGEPLGRLMAQNLDNTAPYVQQFCQLMLDLHQLDVDTQDGKTIKQWLAFAEGYASQHAQLDFSPAFEWLKANLPNQDHLAMIHLDFHPLNVLVTPDGDAYVIDWGSSLVGDFRMDLAWTLLLVESYRDKAARNNILQTYEKLRGESVEHLHFFEAIAALRRLFDISMSIKAGATSLGMRPEAVEMMKQQVDHIENVYAILQNRTGLSLPEVEEFIASLK